MLDGTIGYLYEIDKSLEMTELIRAGEAGYARDCRAGTAFGKERDALRLDAYTLGLLDVFAGRLGRRDDSLRLLTYLHKLVALGPGYEARQQFGKMVSLNRQPALTRYVAGGRIHGLRLLGGKSPEIGLFAELLVDEIESS